MTTISPMIKTEQNLSFSVGSQCIYLGNTTPCGPLSTVITQKLKDTCRWLRFHNGLSGFNSDGILPHWQLCHKVFSFLVIFPSSNSWKFEGDTVKQENSPCIWIHALQIFKWLQPKNYARYQQIVGQSDRSMCLIFLRCFPDYFEHSKGIFGDSFTFKFDIMASLLLASQCSLTLNFQMAVI